MDKPQSATFTISADTPQELARLLRRIADALDGAGPEASSPAISPTSPPGTPSSSSLGEWSSESDLLADRAWGSPLAAWRWSPSAVADLWDRVDTSGARHALKYLARRGGSVPVEDLGRELDKEPGPALAGTLSPIGRAITAMDAQPPYRRRRSHYKVDDDFARAFLEFLRSSRPSGVDSST